MRKIQDWAICVGLFAAVGACASTPTASEAVSPSFSGEIFAPHADGGVIHHLSGGYCPKNIGDFVLTDPTIFHPDGTDVACTFELHSEANDGEATVYFSRFGADKFQTFADLGKPLILQRFPSIEYSSADSDVCRNNLLTPPLSPEAACQIYYGETMDTALAMTLFGDWHAKIRLTVSSNLDVPTSGDLPEFDLGSTLDEIMSAVTVFMNGEFTPDT